MPASHQPIIAIALCAIASSLLALAPAQATGSPATAVYLPLLMRPRDASAVDVASREDSRLFFQQIYRTAEGRESGWTGSIDRCTPGALDARFQQGALDRVNYFRTMAGVPVVTFDPALSAQAQAAALMMSANGALSHAPPSAWRCYTAAGAEAAGRSDLFLGVHGPDAVTGFMQDPGDGNDMAAHRRWILYPYTQQMGLGDVPPTGAHQAAQALLVITDHPAQRPATRDPFVAWPPAGYVPYPVVFARWSFAYPGADFSVATVAMRRDGAAVAVRQAAPRDGFGENTLVWVPLGLDSGDAWPRPAADTTYTVTIQNVRVGGTSRSFTYRVTVFDPQ